MAGKGFAKPKILQYFFRLQRRCILDDSMLYLGAGAIFVEMSPQKISSKAALEKADRQAVKSAFSILLYEPEVQAKGINQLWLYKEGKTSPWYRVELDKWEAEDESDQAEVAWVEEQTPQELADFKIAWLPVPQAVRQA